MRLPDRPRTLWIDAVCINQASHVEKSQQVALLSQVYAKGTQNLVFLGPDEERIADQAFNAVSLVLEDRDNHSSNASHQWRVESVALERLFSLPWFRRLWVIQEVALAKSSTCHWGKRQKDLRDLVGAAKWLENSSDTPRELMRAASLNSAASMDVFVDKATGHFVMQKPDLVQLFWLVLGFEKTEPRDGVYGILGLLDMTLSPHEIALDNPAALLTVDYSKPLTKVMRDATRYGLYQRTDLGALRLVTHSSDDIDASTEGEFTTWTVRADRHLQPQVYEHFDIDFYACDGLGEWTLLGDLSLGPDTLILEGFIDDQVDLTTSTCEGFASSPGSEDLMWLRSVMLLGNPTCPTPLERTIALLSMSKKQAPWWNVVGSLPRLSDALSGLVKGHYKFFWNDDETINEIIKQKPFIYCKSRRFFVTSRGRAGLGPRCMRPGDILTILKGGTLPLVLRKLGDKFQFMGEAYVCGIMDGEAVEPFKAAGGVLMNFPVC